ncbi:MAG: CoxG family protein [Gammaproteobacteria bacterium]
MELNGRYVLCAPPETVWAALHNTELLTLCISGCKAIRWLSDNTLEAEIELRAGSAHRTYKGEVRIADQRPPSHYRLLFGESGESSSVVTDIELIPKAQDTRLSYHVDANLDGYLARLGAPVVRVIARRIANSFFKRLNAELAGAHAT